MAEWRLFGTPCPINEEPVDWAKLCGDCKYFRGMSMYINKKVNCNWPRNGSEIAQVPLPKYIREAKWDEDVV